MATSSKKSSGVDIVEVERRIGKDAELMKGLKRIDLALLKESSAAFESAFHRLWAFEHANDAVSAKACKDLCFAATTIALRHIDSTGVSRAVGRLASHASDFSYERNLAAMAFDHMYLVQTLGVPEAKVMRFWRHVDAHRVSVIRTMSKDGFAFEPLVARAARAFDSEGEPWQHMSPGLWTKLGGGALAAVNIAGAVGAITGVGAAVAILSGLAGGAAILAG